MCIQVREFGVALARGVRDSGCQASFQEVLGSVSLVETLPSANLTQTGSKYPVFQVSGSKTRTLDGFSVPETSNIGCLDLLGRAQTGGHNWLRVASFLLFPS